MYRWLLAVIITVLAMNGLPEVVAAVDMEAVSLSARSSSRWMELAQMAIPRILVETEEGYQFKETSGTDGVQRLTIGTDHLAVIRRFWKNDRYRSSQSAWPVLQTTVEWDPASGTYTLTRVELGFFRRWVWLIHQLPDAEDRYGSIGVQIKMEW
jgi:hypothetical protein